MSTTTTEPDVVDAEVVDDVVEPAQAEADADEPTNEEQVAASREVAQRVAKMDLTLDGNSDPAALSPAQQSALKSIVNFDLKEPGAWGNVLAFMHMCVKRGLDPFAREAYLIARGRGDNRKYTMQTGIDGYRILAARTGKFVGVKNRVWTGSGDDDKSWREDPATGIMRRVWWDQWPTSRGFPGAARVTIVHYDDHGHLTETDYVADWDMYCPLYDEWVNRQKTGKKVPGDMWVKGGPMMLSKCAEAAGLRMAIPGGLNGLYIHEEMQRADQIEADRQRDEARTRIVEAQAAKVTKAVPEPAAEPEPAAAAEEPGEAPAGPPPGVPDAPVEVEPVEVPDGVEPVGAPDGTEPVAPQDAADDYTPEQALAWLREEIGYQSRVLGRPVTELVKRQMSAAGVTSAGDLTAEDLAEVVFPNRSVVIAALQRQGDGEEAEVYGKWGAEQIGPIAVLTGQTQS